MSIHCKDVELVSQTTCSVQGSESVAEGWGIVINRKWFKVKIDVS